MAQSKFRDMEAGWSRITSGAMALGAARGGRSKVPVYGNDGGGARRLVARSKLYASSISLGSLHAVPVKDTPKGAGFATNPGGNGTMGAFGTIPYGTITVGYPALAARAATLEPGKTSTSRLYFFKTASIPSSPTA